MLWVAMMGMHFGCRERLKNFSSPVGSLSPTVAKLLIFVTNKHDLPKMAVWMRFHLGHAV